MAKGSTKKKSRKDVKQIHTKRSTLLKIAIPAALICVFFLTIYLYFGNSRYFKLERIAIVDRSRATNLNDAELLKLYKGRNIFSVNIASLASSIKRDNPVIKQAIVRRILPNELEIQIVPRVPVAKVKLRGYFPIDRTGMVLSQDLKSGALPVIMGLSLWLQPRVGEQLKNRELEKAFQLLDALEESAISAEHNVTAIDISNQRNISLYLENGIEVKIGGEDFPARLKKLRKTFSNPNLDTDSVKYIDLRFRDVVIGPK